MGSKKAAVLPEPVWAQAIKSKPLHTVEARKRGKRRFRLGRESTLTPRARSKTKEIERRAVIA